MAVVRVVQPAIDEIVAMVAVWNQRVAAFGSMRMAMLARRAGGRIAFAHLDPALIEVVAVQMVQAAIVQVVRMLVVPDGGMAAALAVDVGVITMNLMVRHAVFRLADPPRLAQAVSPGYLCY